MKYLMLNPDDITEVLGEVTDEQIRNEKHLKQSQINSKISRDIPFYKGCLLIENEFNDRRNSFFDEVMIAKNDKGSCWYATKECRIYRLYKNGKKRILQFGRSVVSTKQGSMTVSLMRQGYLLNASYFQSLIRTTA